MFKKRTPKLRRALEMVGCEVVYANAPIPHISKDDDIMSTLGKQYGTCAHATSLVYLLLKSYCSMYDAE